MSRLPIEIKEQAFRLRTNGYSIKEIADKLHISKGTSSLWLRNVKLNKKAKERLKSRKLSGYYKSSLSWRNKRIRAEKQRTISALKVVNKIKQDPNHLKVYCSLLYWCEGGKTDKYGVRFINSDPDLIRTFLYLFRKAFPVDEKKFRVLLHLHKYHNEKKQKAFWSTVTGISEKQFLKTFHKPNTGKRIKDNYPGCAAIYYYNTEIAREMRTLSKVFANKLRPTN